MAESVETGETYKGDFYCVKCKEKREAEGRVVETNGRRMAKGSAPCAAPTSTASSARPDPPNSHRAGPRARLGSRPLFCPGRAGPVDDGVRPRSLRARVASCTRCPDVPQEGAVWRPDPGSSRTRSVLRRGARRAAGRDGQRRRRRPRGPERRPRSALVARLDGSLDLPALDALAARTGVAPGPGGGLLQALRERHLLLDLPTDRAFLGDLGEARRAALRPDADALAAAYRLPGDGYALLAARRRQHVVVSGEGALPQP